MRRSVRRLIGWGLSLVFGTAALLQAAVPACGHHAVHGAAETPATHAVEPAAADPHAHHVAHVDHAAHASHATPSPDAPDAPAPCDCIDDCCATALEAWSAPTSFAVSAVAVVAQARVVSRAAPVPAIARAHRQPPATAPPVTRDV
jgi:hypothetical protein